MQDSILRKSMLLRMAVVAILALFLFIPVGLVSGLVYERQTRRDAAVEEVSGKWGRAQTITGPIVTIPIRQTFRDNKGKVSHQQIDYLHWLPEQLEVASRLTSHVRYRGIYRVVLYTLDLNLAADFQLAELAAYLSADREALWDRAFMTLGISDLKGIKEIAEATWNRSPVPVDPGLRSKDVVASGLTLLPPLSSGPGHFSLRATINGSEQVEVTPVGKTTILRVSSDWGDPSFVGDFLPEKRTVTDKSFTADWRVLHLNRNYPQSWYGAEHKVDSSAFGVRLLLPIDEYQKNSRAVKYAGMFIALVFLAFFLIDLQTRTALHPIQYGLVAFALILFYVLLLSVSEHMPFDFSYYIASGVITILVSLYLYAVTRRRAVAAFMAALLVVQYGFLYVLMRLEDYALLLGSLGLLLILGLVMYLTRKVDWFNVGRGEGQSTKPVPSPGNSTLGLS
jgi:inner membrane protein